MRLNLALPEVSQLVERNLFEVDSNPLAVSKSSKRVFTIFPSTTIGLGLVRMFVRASGEILLP